MLGHFERDGSENPYSIQRDLQDTMHELVGIIRTQYELETAYAKLQELKQRAQNTGVEGHRQYNPGWHLAMDLRSMLLCSEAITIAAIERKESRGAHTRDDFPGTDAAFSKVNCVVRPNATGDPEVTQEPLPQMPEELAALLEEQKS
jgi:succinate dehydrogenase / fumarate reductase flavoprotein subunit